MARFQKFFGGIEIAPNGFVKNLVIEQLDQDPTTLVKGRVWFNTSDKVYKCVMAETDSDGNETLVVKTLGTDEDLQAFIQKLASTNAGEGSALVGFSGHDGANGLVKIAAGTMEDSLSSLIDAVDVNAKDIDDLQDKVNANTDDLQAEIDNIETGAGLADDGSYSANANANYIADATSLADADNKLDAALKAQADKEAQDIANLQQEVQDNYLSKTSTDDQTVESNVEFKKNIVIDGDLLVKGATTEIETTNLKVGDNIITLNDDVPADQDPTESAGIEINRGTEGIMPFIIWDESDDTPKVATGEKDSDGNWILAPIATGGDADAIQAELDKAEAGAGLADDGSYVVNSNANYIADATSLADADNKLDAALKAQADKEAQDVADLNTKADNIQAELDNTQAGAGLATDGSYQANSNANYIANATSLADADNKLDAQVKTNADNIASVDNKVETFRTDLNNTRVTYEATDAATSFTITHNLGSQMIDVMVWVYDDTDGKWYNDQVVVSVVDDNTIQVDLTSAAKIRATIVNVGYVF